MVTVKDREHFFTNKSSMQLLKLMEEPISVRTGNRIHVNSKEHLAQVACIKRLTQKRRITSTQTQTSDQSDVCTTADKEIMSFITSGFAKTTHQDSCDPPPRLLRKVHASDTVKSVREADLKTESFMEQYPVCSFKKELYTEDYE